MKDSRKKNPVILAVESDSSARPQIHNALAEKKETVNETVSEPVSAAAKTEEAEKNTEEEKEKVQEKSAKGRKKKKKKEKKKKKPKTSLFSKLGGLFRRKKKDDIPHREPLEAVLPKPVQIEKKEVPPVSPRVEIKVESKAPRSRRSHLRWIIPLTFPVGGVLAMMAPWTLWFAPPAVAVKLYPSTCLGGWENPKNAESVPSLPVKSPPDAFNDRNSAVLRNSLAQIFCGDFKDAFPEGAFPKKMLLKFSWTTIAPVVSSSVASAAEIPSPGAPSVPGDFPDQTPSSGETALNNEAPSTSPSVNASSTKEAKEKPPEKPSAEIKVQPSSDESDSPPMLIRATPFNTPKEDTKSASSTSLEKGKPVSFLEKWFNVAFAESPPKTSPNTANGTTSQPQNMSTTSPEESTAVSNQPKATGADFLQVLYTLDGENWKQLGMVTRENLADMSFQVPVSDPKDLAHFQVSIQNVISLDDPPVIYLDGMWLESGE